MNKLLIATMIAAGLLAGCSDNAEKPASASKPTAAKASSAGSAQATTAVSDTKPIVAPKPPPPPGGGQSAPELKPEDIARIQEMLKKRNAEKPTPAPAAPAVKK